MAQHYGVEKRDCLILKSVTCDECGADCINTHIEIFTKMSYSEKTEKCQVVCLACYCNIYRLKKEKHDENLLKLVKLEANNENNL